MIAAGYDFGILGIDDLTFGVAYGSFEADNISLYESKEIDAILEYSWNEKISLTVAFTSVDFKMAAAEDYDQFRVIANYNF